MAERIDKILVQLGLVNSRTKSHDLIKEKAIYFKDILVQKPSLKIPSDSQILDFKIMIKDDYVGRGAHKIEAAIQEFHIELQDQIVADVGACTGGFTDYVLQNHAQFVYAIDVGHGQLAKTLIDDKRVENLEGTNIRYGVEKLFESCDLAVIDLSFISLKLVLSAIFDLVKQDGCIVALVKPQFEVGKSGLKKNGLVKSDELRMNCLENLFDFCEEYSFYIKGIMKSVVEGKKSGNTEYFFYFDKSLASSLVKREDIKKLFN